MIESVRKIPGFTALEGSPSSGLELQTSPVKPTRTSVNSISQMPHTSFYRCVALTKHHKARKLNARSPKLCTLKPVRYFSKLAAPVQLCKRRKSMPNIEKKKHETHLGRQKRHNYFWDPQPSHIRVSLSKADGRGVSSVNSHAALTHQSDGSSTSMTSK